MISPKTLATLLRYMNHFHEFPIKYLLMDNVQESRFHAFEDFCTALGINHANSVAYEYSQNGLAEAFVKKIQLVARPLLLHAKLSSSMWGRAVLYAAILLKLIPIMLYVQTPHELLIRRPPNVQHIRAFGYQVLVPLRQLKRLMIGPHCQEDIYVGFYSTSIIRNLKPTTRKHA